MPRDGTLNYEVTETDDVLWRVHGDLEYFLFASKMEAEIYARLIHPEKNADERYATLYFNRMATIKIVN